MKISWKHIEHLLRVENPDACETARPDDVDDYDDNNSISCMFKRKRIHNNNCEISYVVARSMIHKMR